MKRLIIVLPLVAVLIATGSVASVSGDGPPWQADPFVGAWESVDPEGCNQYLGIARRPWGYGLLLFDRCADVCEGSPGIAKGRGAAAEGFLQADLRMRCPSPPPPLWELIHLAIAYHADTDTLEDGSATWYRMGSD